jgi:hypothetical protein
MPRRKVPSQIKKSKYGWFFGSEWNMIHNEMQNNAFVFFIGANGSGKTYAALKRAEILGLDKRGYYGTLFDPDHLEKHLFFDKNDMLKRIKEVEKWPLYKRRGYQFILDEAQISANAKEWNQKDVISFAKDMTTIRSSRLSISLTMPTYDMIATDLRKIGSYYVEMKHPSTINLTDGKSYSKLHILTLKAFLSDIWRERPKFETTTTNFITGLPQKNYYALNEVAWELPSKNVIKSYEEMKSAFREKRSELSDIRIANEKDKEIASRRVDFGELLDFVKVNKEKFFNDKGSVDWGLIISKVEGFKIPKSTAQKVAQMVNNNIT